MTKLKLPPQRPSDPPAQLPTEAAGALAAWYERNRRDLPWRRTRDPYAIWVSEVMLQQTQVKTVIPYYQRFMDLFPNPAALACADPQAVLKAWEGLGYYSRARNMHRAAQAMHEVGGRVPSEWSALRKLPGIGDYIAAAVLSIAFAQPYAVVDGNVKRVLARLLCIDSPINLTGSAHAAYQAAADRFLDPRQPGRHNQAVMELGALVCTPRQALCALCPLQGHCRALRAAVVDDYPRRAPRPSVGEQQWAAGLIVKNGRLLMVRRPSDGLLGGMWEFPSVRPQDGEEPAQACTDYIRRALGLSVHLRGKVACVRHAYTHFKLRLEVFRFDCPSGRIRLDGPAAFQWVPYGRTCRLPLHRAAQKVVEAVTRDGKGMLGMR
jgi:A/G-specific adenine glycosylase